MQTGSLPSLRRAPFIPTFWVTNVPAGIRTTDLPNTASSVMLGRLQLTAAEFCSTELVCAILETDEGRISGALTELVRRQRVS